MKSDIQSSICFFCIFSRTACLQPKELIVWVTDGWMDVIKLFSNCYSSYSFCLILTKVGTRDLCANVKKNCGTDFRNVALTILGLNF